MQPALISVVIGCSFLIPKNMKQELETENKNVQQSAGQVNNLVDADLRRPAQMDEDRRQRLEKLGALRLTTATEVAPEVSSLSVDGIGFFALDDVHAIKAKAKQGKTTMLKVCLSAWLRGSQFRVKSELEEPRILWLDTEQKQSDVKLIISDVLSMAGVDAAMWTATCSSTACASATSTG